MCFNGISEEKLKSSIRACFPCKGSHDTEWVFGLHAFRRSLVWSILCIHETGCIVCCVYRWEERDITKSHIFNIVHRWQCVVWPIHAELKTHKNILYENRNKKQPPRGVGTVLRKKKKKKAGTRWEYNIFRPQFYRKKGRRAKRKIQAIKRDGCIKCYWNWNEMKR